MDNGGSWVQIPSGARIFATFSLGFCLSIFPVFLSFFVSFVFVFGLFIYFFTWTDIYFRQTCGLNIVFCFWGRWGSLQKLMSLRFIVILSQHLDGMDNPDNDETLEFEDDEEAEENDELESDSASEYSDNYDENGMDDSEDDEELEFDSDNDEVELTKDEDAG